MFAFIAELFPFDPNTAHDRQRAFLSLLVLCLSFLLYRLLTHFTSASRSSLDPPTPKDTLPPPITSSYPSSTTTQPAQQQQRECTEEEIKFLCFSSLLFMALFVAGFIMWYRAANSAGVPLGRQYNADLTVVLAAIAGTMHILRKLPGMREEKGRFMFNWFVGTLVAGMTLGSAML